MNWKAGLLILGFCGAAFMAVAQPYTSRLGRFQVDQKSGCAPFTVTVTVISPFVCDSGNPCDMDYEGNNQFQSLTFTHTYAQPGNYTLKILFQAAGFDDIAITVTPNTLPDFDLYTCGNNEISVNITDKNYNQYVIDYNDGSPAKVVPSGNLAKDQHTYASSGSKSVTVHGRNVNAADNCDPATKPVTALATLPAPVITNLTVIDNATVKLDFSAQPNILYKLEIATNQSSAFQLYKNSYNVSTETLTNLKPDDNYYCFRLGAYDPCNNTTAYSNVICSSNFDLSAQNNSNNLTWATSTAGISNLRLSRSTQGSSFVTSVTGSSYSDTDVMCGSRYCYQLTTNYPNGSKSVSLEKCDTAISTNVPSAVENISSVVTEPGVDLQWLTPIDFTPSEFSVFYSSNGTYTLLTATSAVQLHDDTYTTESGICYKISYKDVCDNVSPLSAEACPIRLTAALQKDNSVALTWTAYGGWKNGVNEYTVEKYSEQGQLLQTFQPGTSLAFTDDTQDLDNQVSIYLVKATAVDNGIVQSVSNRIVVTKNPNLFHPTAFTPNGDNLNDLFNVYGQYINAFEMSIFNRWGELMFSTTDLEKGWDGNFSGSPMPEGTYTFVAHITDRAGRTFKKSGSVLLLRKQK